MTNIVLKRFDSFTIPKVSQTKEGFLRGEACVSRTGVFKYFNIDGTVRRELRHPDDVFNTDSLDSIKMIPITDDHPAEFVNSSNASKLQKGTTGENYRLDNQNIITTLTITNQDLIDKILTNSKCELSMGYNVTLVKESGNYDGEEYDYRQTDIYYNHLALVERGRAGREVRIRTDGEAELITNNIKEDNMSEKKTDTNYDADPIIAEKVARIDALTNEIDLLKHKNSTLEKKLDSITELANKKELELAKEKATKTDSIVNALAEERVIVFARALPFLRNDTFSFVNHTNREVMEAAINSMRQDKANFEGKSDEYVAGVFETFVATNSPTTSNDRDQIWGVLAANNDMAGRTQGKTMHDTLIKQLKEKMVK